MPLNIAAGFAIALAIVFLTFVVYVTYNAVVALVQRIDKAWANIDVALKQRHDELPNLVAAVRGLLDFEQGVLERVTTLRAAYRASDPISQQAITSEATSAAVQTLFATVERYPDIKAAANVLALQTEIERLEGIIADRRELYNDSVYRYNTTIRQFPGVVLAGLFSWRPREFFRVEPGDAARPDAALSGVRGA